MLLSSAVQDSCCAEHSERHRRDLENHSAATVGSAAPGSSSSQFPASPSNRTLLLEAERTDDELQDAMPETVLFVQEVTELMGVEFPNLWRLGQAYFRVISCCSYCVTNKERFY